MGWYDGKMKIEWLDAGREAQCLPNPKYPLGVAIDVSRGEKPACTVDLPYPAPRCGAWVVECQACGMRVAITAAGRVDDPRAVTMACKSGWKLGEKQKSEQLQ